MTFSELRDRLDLLMGIRSGSPQSLVGEVTLVYNLPDGEQYKLSVSEKGAGGGGGWECEGYTDGCPRKTRPVPYETLRNVHKVV